MKQIILIAAVLGSMIATSCQQLKPFTEDLRSEYGWSEEDLTQVQFYLSDDIILERAFSGGKTEFSEGKIKVVDGKKIEQIIIPKNTPGVLLFMPKKNRLAVSFEEGDDGKFLVFGPSPKYGDRYVLLAAKWKRNKGIITYNGNKYATSSNSAFSTLLVDMKEVREYEKKSRVAGGRTLD